MEKEAKKGFFSEFKEFIMRGNVIDLAVGVIIGAAFQAIIGAKLPNTRSASSEPAGFAL